MVTAPHEVATRPQWEIGEMEGNFCVACADENFKGVVALYLVHAAGDGKEISLWAWAVQFDGEKAALQEICYLVTLNIGQ